MVISTSNFTIKVATTLHADFLQRSLFKTTKQLLVHRSLSSYNYQSEKNQEFLVTCLEKVVTPKSKGSSSFKTTVKRNSVKNGRSYQVKHLPFFLQKKVIYDLYEKLTWQLRKIYIFKKLINFASFVTLELGYLCHNIDHIIGHGSFIANGLGYHRTIFHLNSLASGVY